MAKDLLLSCKQGMKAMAEIKSFAGDAYWAVIDEVQTACRTPAQRRWYAGVTIYLLFAFLIFYLYQR